MYPPPNTTADRFPISTTIVEEVDRFEKLLYSLVGKQVDRWGDILSSLIEAGKVVAIPDADPVLQDEWLEEADAVLTVLCCEARMGELADSRLMRSLQGESV